MVESVPFRHFQGPGEPCDIRAQDRWAQLAGEGGVEQISVFEAWPDLESKQPGHVPRTGPIPIRPPAGEARRRQPYWARISDWLKTRRRFGDPATMLIPDGAAHDDIARAHAAGWPRLRAVPTAADPLNRRSTSGSRHGFRAGFPNIN